MPKRKDIEKILIIGSGAIVISQAGEFDYSGTQACKSLKEEGYKVILVNSNPATIMTDTQFADATYIEPLNIHIIEKIIIKERPDALLPTLGGQTALNLAVELYEAGILDKYNVELIGANISCIKKAEDRRLFKESMKKINVDVCKSEIVEDVDTGVEFAEKIGFPVILRPSFTLGGSGGGIAYNKEELVRLLERALEISPVHSVLVEESLIGWKEFELELMRDVADNVVVICTIENFDPMGVHTGDSITVAPAQTLSDKEYQRMRSTAIKIIREIGVETGGSNIQFAINPDTGRMVAIEINPRVSRSSALASKATGFAIAKIAAKLAVGLRLDEIPNDITKKTPACFEPTIDYVVVKIPKFCFEKFEGACETLGSEMKSVGEVMAIGRTFKEALQKAIHSLEIDKFPSLDNLDIQHIKNKLITPHPERLFYIIYALENNIAVDDIYKWTKIDKWFLHNIKEIVDVKQEIKKSKIMEKESVLALKKLGFLDVEIAEIFNTTPEEVYDFRKKHNILPTYKVIDTCSAEFESYTPYLYSSYETEDELSTIDVNDNKKKVVILGSGPNRIGQGIEFDYCCCHAVFSLKEEGYQTIMINSNPETVSTDYDTACKLYFEPLTEENVLNVIEREKPVGVILQFGGQTPLKLAIPLKKRGVKILGTQPESIDIAEDRDKFSMLLKKLNINQAPYSCVNDYESAIKAANRLGYPVLLRPSYVLGGRAMAIVYDDDSLAKYIKEAIELSFKHPLLIDKFLEDATEVDVDAVSDGKEVVIAGIMEHIEEAGIHSGDSACVLPPRSLSKDIINVIKDYTIKISLALRVVGLINIQYAIKDGVVYVLEANPRASRTVPFVSKATGVAWAKIAAKLAIGKSIKELNVREKSTNYISVKESVLPFIKFPEVDPILGPQMRSTGEVMGIDSNFGLSYAKAQMSVKEQTLPLGGCAFLSVRDKDKQSIIEIAKELKQLGFKLLATEGTAFVLNSCGLEAEVVYKVGEGRPNVVDYIKNNKIQLIINTPLGKFSKYDEAAIRKNAVRYKVPYITTIQATKAAVAAIWALKTNKINVMSLQERWNLKS